MTEDMIRERAVCAIEAQVFPGCVVGVVHRDGRRLVVACGAVTYGEKSPLVTVQTVYDLASVTKSLVTASCALMAIEQGTIGLHDSVSRYLPELQNHYEATIEDLLRYRVQGVRMSTLQHETFEEIRTHVLETGFRARAGESVYTNLPAYLLGMIVERVGRASLAELSHRYFFDPLGMYDTTFFPTASDCAPTEIDSRGEVRGLPHDESARVFARARRTAGHAGLFSTAPDPLIFLQALLDGKYPHITTGAERGLGWQTSGDFLGSHASARAFGKTGFTGTSVCVDPEKGIAFVILSNRTYPHRPPDDSAIHRFRREIADIILR